MNESDGWQILTRGLVCRLAARIREFLLVFFTLFDSFTNLTLDLSTWVRIILTRVGDDLIKIIVRTMWNI